MFKIAFFAVATLRASGIDTVAALVEQLTRDYVFPGHEEFFRFLGVLADEGNDIDTYVSCIWDAFEGEEDNFFHSTETHRSVVAFEGEPIGNVDRLITALPSQETGYAGISCRLVLDYQATTYAIGDLFTELSREDSLWGIFISPKS